ncbi:MAG: penicillin acylase family protein, partial [Bacteroidetes bacterium]|nr:penicillin acylase family protein [Bacteroidota bacterium]
MKSWVKTTLAVIISIIVIILIGGAIFYNMLNSSLPEYKDEISLNGIDNNIEIYRDSVAVPYIIAQTESDAAFALGYVHAQERLFTMDIARRAGAGKLSEIFGEKTILFDKMFLTVGIKRNLIKNLAKYNRNNIKLLKAYSRGVNFFIKNAGGKLPIEFSVLGYEPEEWRPIHSLIIMRMMAWELNIGWWTDFAYTELVQKVGVEKAKEILPAYPKDAPVIIPKSIANLPKINNSFVRVEKQFRKFLGLRGTHIGSNSWVVDGSMSESGKPIIANDTHLAFSAPDKWFAAVIKAGNLDAAGFTLPGIPGIVIGKNKSIAWAMTNIMADDADFYSEKIDSSGKKYFYDGKWFNLKIIKDTINVRNSTPVVNVTKITRNGPIISDIHPLSFLYKNEPETFSPISMHWLGSEFSDELNAIYNVNKAKNFYQFKKALNDFGVPGQNFIYGDKKGNIGYVFAADLPLRKFYDASYIIDGTRSKFRWKGILNRNKIPYLLNPPNHFIASANNKTLKNFKYYISNLWEPSSRIDRITQLLKSKKKHSLEDFKNYQMDFVSPYAKEITGHLLSAFSNIKVVDDNLRKTLSLFKQWDFNFNKYSQTPLIYAAFFKTLIINIYEDEMGEELLNDFVFIANVPYRSIQQILNEDDNSWYDNINTPKLETKNYIIRKSLTDALDYLENKLGKKMDYWQWGNLHQVTFKHIFIGKLKVLDNLVIIGT